MNIREKLADMEQRAGHHRVLPGSLTCWMTAGLVAVVLAACMKSPPHDNPLDPASPDYHPFAWLQGRCTAAYDTERGIPGVLLRLQGLASQDSAANLLTRTDQNGRFSFAKVDTGTYYLIAQKDGYAIDTLQVALLPNDSTDIVIPMDALPQLAVTKLLTGHFFDPQDSTDQYIFDFAVDVTDPDRTLDVQNTICLLPEYQWSFALEPERERIHWTTQYRLPLANAVDPDFLLGTAIYFSVETNTNFRRRDSRFGPSFLTRFIHIVPQLIAPADGAIVGNQPTFAWVPVSFSFNVELEISLQRLTALGEEERIKIKPSAGENSVTFTGTLAPANYIWTLEIRDQFGNWALSNPATFQVQIQ